LSKLRTISKASKQLQRQGLHDDKIERIKSYYLSPHPDPLDEADELTRQRLEEIWRLATADQKTIDPELPSRAKIDICEYITKLWGISRSQGFYLIRQSEQVFGWVNKVDKDGLRAMQTDRYLKLVDLAIKEKSPELAVKLLERIDKINGLEEKTSEQVDIEGLMGMLEVHLSSNPKVLVEATDAQVIDE
jgi:hypothetical protein